MPQTITLDQIALRKAERGFLAGGTETGKSTLADALAAYFLWYYRRQKPRHLLADTKPRYRAERTIQGIDARRRYKNWDHGQSVPNSIVVEDPSDLKLAWSLGATTVIAQGDSDDDVKRITAITEEFLRESRTNRPQLIQVDETMDFFHGNGAPRGGSNVILRTARAGRERGTAGLYCSQRTKGIPAQLMEEMKRLYAFRLDFKDDARRFQEMGAPPFALPKKTREFCYWFKEDYDHVYGPYTLDLGKAKR